MVTCNAATGYVAKMVMLRLNIGSGMLRLSSFMLSIGHVPECERGKGGREMQFLPFSLVQNMTPYDASFFRKKSVCPLP